jgi:hypothetical protein
LLLGFLCERSHLTLADVEEVVREFAKESEVPNRAPERDDDMAAGAAPVTNGHLDLSALQLDPTMVKTITQQLDALGVDQHIDQLQRLERSVLRLERVNVQTLGMLKKLVSAVKKTSDEPSK